MTKALQLRFALFISALLVLLLAWHETVLHIYDLVTKPSAYTHGQLVPFISLWLIWNRREVLKSESTRFSVFGLMLFIGAALLWIIGEVLVIKIAGHIALITAINALVLTVWGTPTYKKLLFPMLFLYLAVPIGASLIPHMQNATAVLVLWMLKILGVPFEAEGVLISLSSGMYEIAAACAGVQFLFTSIVTGVLMAHLAFSSWKRRIAIVVLAALIPILANAFRVLGILLIAEYTDQSFAKGVDHIVYGWGFLSVILLTLIAIAYKFADKPFTDFSVSEHVNSTSAKTLPKHFSVLVTLGIFFVPVMSYLAIPHNGFSHKAIKKLEVPACENCKVRLLSSMPREISGTEAAYSARYRMGADIIDVSAGLFCPLPSNIDIPRVLIPEGGNWTYLPSGNYQISLPPNWTFSAKQYRRADEKQVTFRSTYSGGKGKVSPLELKLASGIERLTHGKTAGAIIEIRILESEGMMSPRDILMNFLSTFPPDSFLWSEIKPDAEGKIVCVE